MHNDTRLRRRGFTLTEVLVAMTVFAILSAISLSSFLAVLRHSRHAEDATATGNSIRYATDLVAQTVRSAALAPEITNGGRVMRLIPNEPYFATVDDTATVDPLPTPPLLGSLAGQRTIRISVVARQPATVWALSAGCPTAPIGAPSAAFVAADDLPNIDLASLFAVGDTISLPLTGIGGPQERIIQSITNDAGAKALVVTSNLLWAVPNGTQIPATSGRWIRFSIEDDGALRYYRDDRDLDQFTVIAHDIHTAPRSDPFNAASSIDQPFRYDPAARVVTINLQSLPAGNRGGRTVVGSRTVVHVRTDPLTFGIGSVN